MDIEDDKDAEDAEPQSQDTNTFNNIYLGATQKPRSISDIENAYVEDPAFNQFQSRLEKSLNEILHRDDSPIQIQNTQGLLVTANNFVSWNHLYY